MRPSHAPLSGAPANARAQHAQHGCSKARPSTLLVADWSAGRGSRTDRRGWDTWTVVLPDEGRREREGPRPKVRPRVCDGDEQTDGTSESHGWFACGRSR
eukprot:scaffold867_cov317-Pavlova_lutheri.AAC.17